MFVAAGKQQERRVGVVMSYNAVARTAEVCWLDQLGTGRPGGKLLQSLQPNAPRVTLPVYSILVSRSILPKHSGRTLIT